jgi:hypothetical protein
LDPSVLKLLCRKDDQGVDLFGRVIPPCRVGLADLAVAFARLRQAIEGNTDPDKPPVCVLIPPVGLDPCPRFVDWIHQSTE